MQLQCKPQKTAEITYLEANKQKTKNRVTLWRFWGNTKVRLIFLGTEDSMKGKCYVFSASNEKKKVWYIYLECKLREDSYDWCIFKLKF